MTINTWDYTREDRNQSGVYRINNILNGKCYVGGTKQKFTKRWELHLYSLKKNKHYSKPLQADWNKFGETFFTFEILEVCSAEIVIETEQKCIDFYKPEYNNSTKAGGLKGVKLTKETREKMSRAKKGLKMSDEHKAKIGRSNTGKVRTPGLQTEEMKQKARELRIGKPLYQNRKVTDAQVKEMRTMYTNQNILLKDLAILFGISPSSVGGIIKNKYRYDPEYTPPQ